MPEKCSAVIVDGLRKVFAETYSLYLKTQNYHWNVTGLHFASLHAMFESQYEELAEAIDEIAERLRILGVPAPGTFEEIQTLTSIKSGAADQPADRMLSDLLDGHSTLIHAIGGVIRAAGDVNDEGTVGLLSERLTSHEKAAWKLKSSLP